MGFESGAVSFRWYHLPHPLPDDAIERLAAHAAPPLEAIGAEEVGGWVSSRHLLDRVLKAESVIREGWILATLRLSARKIPPALLAAECRMEELALRAVEDSPAVRRRQRQEIRRAVIERLLPQMPPQFRAIPMAHRPTTSFLYAAALSDSLSDLFTAHFRHTFGFPATSLDAAAAAVLLRRLDVRDLPPASFSPQVPDRDVPVEIGREFLTWLWFQAETVRDRIEVPRHPPLALQIEGPLVLAREGEGAHVTTLRDGEPLYSAEAKTCLMAGKRLCRARFAVGVQGMVWRMTFDGDTFVFRSLTLPEDPQRTDPGSRFLERMMRLETFREIWLALYGRFLDERTDSNRWTPLKSRMREWVQQRPAHL